MNNNKPREFWIQDSGKTMQDGILYAKLNHSSFFNLHVIEKSTYDQLMEDARALREAIFRINENYQISIKASSFNVKASHYDLAETKANKALEDFDKKYPQLNDRE